MNDNGQIIDLYKSGLNILEVARIVRRSNQHVTQVIRRAGITRSSKSSLSSDMENEICTLYKSGVSMPRIAKDVSITLWRVRSVLAKYDIDTSPKRYSTTEDIDLIVEMYRQKYTGSEIAEELGISQGVVYKELKRAGISGKRTVGPKGSLTRYLGADGLITRFRSTWEAAFARHLDSLGLKWAYEAHTYILSDGRSYTPDFWIPSLDRYFEVKGYMSDAAAEKLELFISQYPGIDLQIVDKDTFAELGINVSGKPSPEDKGAEYLLN